MSKLRQKQAAALDGGRHIITYQVAWHFDSAERFPSRSVIIEKVETLQYGVVDLLSCQYSIRDVVQCRVTLTVVCNRTDHVPGQGDSFQTIGKPSGRYHDGVVHPWWCSLLWVVVDVYFRASEREGSFGIQLLGGLGAVFICEFIAGTFTCVSMTQKLELTLRSQWVKSCAREVRSIGSKSRWDISQALDF
jgi:hypothetical protein